METSNRPAVSVIVPVYGAERYIEECVVSLMEQTLDSVEYLFVDDCSPDRSVEIIERTVARYPRRSVRIIRNEHNIGCCASRYKGISEAKGEYIGFCDDDDFCHVDMFERLYAKAKEGGYDMVYCDIEEARKLSNGSVELTRRHITTAPNGRDLCNAMLHFRFNGACATIWNRIIKREILQDNVFVNINRQVFEDCLMIYQFYGVCKSYGYVDAALYRYNVNDDSVMNVASADAKILGKIDNALANLDEIDRLARRTKQSLKDYRDNSVFLRMFAFQMFEPKLTAQGLRQSRRLRRKTLLPAVWRSGEMNLRTKISLTQKVLCKKPL